MNEKISERVLDILEWPAIKEKIQSKCSTSTGAKIVDILQPLHSELVKIQMKKISDIKEMISLGETPDFSGITDIEPLLIRAKKNSMLKLDELMRIRNFIQASNRIKFFLKQQKIQYENIKDEFNRLDKLEEIGNLLLPSILDNGELNTAKYSKLKKIKDSLFSTKQELERAVTKLISSPFMDKIIQEKIYTIINQRYVILVKSGMKGKIKGTVHDISSSGATLYFEPDEIRGLNNRIILLEIDLQKEINRILKSLSREAGNNSESLLNNLEIISYLDFITAASKFSAAIDGNEPEIVNEPVIILYDAKHPLLHIMQPDNVVGNDIELGNEFNCLIISGANTGGKTVLLKTIGLTVLLTMYGLHIPANPDSKIGVFRSILADIGDDQNLAQSLSTYSGQILIINEMLKKSGERTLVLIDEIIVGTNPRQGAALAQAILEEMISTGSRIVVTTHYSELKELASIDNRFQNSSVSFDIDSLKPTYRLIIGMPGASYAIEIARNYGLPESIQSRSKELLDSRDISVESLLEQIQKYKQEMDEERKKISQQKEELAGKKNKYIKKQKNLNRLEEEIKNQHGIEFLNELNKYRRLVSGRISSLQQASIKDAGEIQQEIIKIHDNVSIALHEGSKNKFLKSYFPIDPVKASPGDKVFISSLEKEGKIESIDSSGETAVVLFGGSIRSRFKLSEILIPIDFANRTAQPERKKKKTYSEPQNEGIPLTIQTNYNTIDLRGKRVDEAISFMEQNLDRMNRNSVGAAVIIHGHGTGALKEAVRSNLKFSTYTSDFRPGEYGEGGDGVTIVSLRY